MLLRIENDSLIDYSHYYPVINENNGIIGVFSSLNQNILYLSTSNGLYEFGNKKIIYSPINEFREFKVDPIFPVQYDSQGVLWRLRVHSRTDRDLFMLKNDSIELFKTPQTSWWHGITSIYSDRNNRLWLSNLGTGIAMIDLISGKSTQFDQRNGLPNDYVLNFLEDHEGNIWMGTQGGGIIQYSRNNFIAFKFESIIILTFNGLYIYDGSSLYSANRQYGLMNQYQFSDALMDGNTLWLATQGNGVFRFNNGNIEQL